MSSQAHEDITWFASRPKILPSCEGSCRTRAAATKSGARANTADECGRGIARGEADAARGGDFTARGRTRVRRSLIVKYL